jgi:hypothetical protein
MSRIFVVEIRITDYLEKNYFKQDDPNYHLGVIDLFREQLELVTGGMLCLKHIHIPELQPLSTSEDGWLMKISCCCEIQYSSVYDRVKKLLK